MSDISQEFSFYMDGRFHRQYIGENGADVRNWGTIWKLDLSNANLMTLAGGDHRVPYAPRSREHLRSYVLGGGGLVILSDWNGQGEPPVLQPVAEMFGGGFSGVAAKGKATGVGSLSTRSIEFRGGGTLSVGPTWQKLVVDEDGRPLLARRPYGKGHVLLGARNLFGNRPDASDPINAEWVKPLLQSIASGKEVDRSRPFNGQFAELTRQVGPLTLEYHEGTRKFADGIVKEYQIIRPLLVEVTGVEPSPGMITRLLLLPTGGGGFSSGERIAIGAWWGDYPANRYPMVELIGHEAGHSWVLPYPEPVWNEPIATYLGILVGKKLGLPEADRTLADGIERARRLDPNWDQIDINKPDAPRDAVWGKTYWIFEQLEAKHGPGAIAKYFQAKRRLVKPGRSGYSMDDAVAVWSTAVGSDLFPWFRSLGIDVDRSRTDLK